MAARKNGIFVEQRDWPQLRSYAVSGTDPKGNRVGLVVDGTDPLDAIHQAKKLCALNGWQAVEA